MSPTRTSRPAASSPGEVTVAPPLPAGRRVVLYGVRRLDDATVDEVAELLDMTVSGARQHLVALTEQGLVETTEAPRRPGERGRPRLTYRVTELGDALFPKAYGALTNELLGYLEDEDASVVDRIFCRRRDERIRRGRVRIEAKGTLGAKVREVAQILDEDGYLATAERTGTGTYRVVEHNCAIAAVARRYGQACSSEIDFLRAVLPGTTIQRVKHMVAGDQHCAYEVRAA
jgi:DeoR family transcriptional regulator, suf operon transcriptional repressor